MAKRTTISDMKMRNSRAGQHWFDRDTMRFFGTRIETQPDKHDVFITSEQPPYGERNYSLRQYDKETGKVDTIGKFGGFATLASAREARRSLWE